ncbi:MAG: indolepyruvate oxidoreductase subunit beta [Methanotrichaceae archaeon]|nr:indolepyruvate oxidoreductase subunit beta [Methanotrichaceae archaeon]
MSLEDVQSVVLVGVGGQGILLASEVLAQAAVLSGHRVKTNEVHGMAQRGGSVVAQIRWGQKVYSPLVASGTARVLGSLEQIEALRYAHYLAPNGLAVVSAQAIMPMTVSTGEAIYPKDVPGLLKRSFSRLIYLDAAQAALDLGEIRAANMVVLGAVSTGLDIAIEDWRDAIVASVKERFVEINLRAFEAGRSFS